MNISDYHTHATTITVQYFYSIYIYFFLNIPGYLTPYMAVYSKRKQSRQRNKRKTE